MKSGFEIENIILLESNFFRVSKVSLANENVKQQMTISITNEINEVQPLNVKLALNFKSVCNDITEVECSITMVGIFIKVGTEEVDLDKFGRINGAAIIFPFIREHFSSITLKAGIGYAILPPINFVEKYNSEIQKTSNE